MSKKNFKNKERFLNALKSKSCDYQYPIVVDLLVHEDPDWRPTEENHKQIETVLAWNKNGLETMFKNINDRGLCVIACRVLPTPEAIMTVESLDF